MATKTDVAKWMLDELNKQGVLTQKYAGLRIRELFGDNFTYLNKNLSVAIKKDVLSEFRSLHKGKVKWDKNKMYWSKEVKVSKNIDLSAFFNTNNEKTEKK